jgi:Glycogen recognition site of AMP-activated protein kinase
MKLAHSNDEPGGPSPMNHISVRFVSLSPLQLQIKNLTPMKKTPTPTQTKPIVPSLFQIAASLDVASAAASNKNASEPSQTPLADLIRHPDKLEAALKTARAENEAFAASRTVSRKAAGRPTRTPPPNRDAIKKPKADLPRETRKIEFVLEAPAAKSVKLAADFTDWEKCPLDMMQSEDGVWFNVIPLAPGQYSYRYIVDGQWCDDPRSTRRVPNPFGTENALLVVT